MDIHLQCCEEVARTIRLLKLMPDDQVIVRRRPYTKADDVFRGIVCAPVEEREAPGTNIREDIGYGVLVVDAIGSDASLRENAGTAAERRTAIRRRLIHTRLNITAEGCHYSQTKIEPGELNEIPRGIERHELSFFVARCWVRESRTS